MGNPDENNKNVTRTRKVTVRFTEEEYEKVESKFNKTTCPQLSHFIRRALLEKPITVKYRNQSLDALMEELILLRQELNAIGNNFNQAVKKLHTLEKIPDFRNWLIMNEGTKQQLVDQAAQIQERINKISDKWLQE